jgi:hypothetical protein
MTIFPVPPIRFKDLSDYDKSHCTDEDIHRYTILELLIEGKFVSKPLVIPTSLDDIPSVENHTVIDIGLIAVPNDKLETLKAFFKELNIKSAITNKINHPEGDTYLNVIKDGVKFSSIYSNAKLVTNTDFNKIHKELFKFNTPEYRLTYSNYKKYTDNYKKIYDDISNEINELIADRDYFNTQIALFDANYFDVVSNTSPLDNSREADFELAIKLFEFNNKDNDHCDKIIALLREKYQIPEPN